MLRSSQVRRLVPVFLAAVLFAVGLSVVPRLGGSGEAASAPQLTACTPVDVAAFMDIRRIGVQCAEVQPGGVVWYALESDHPDSSRILSILVGAMTSGRKLAVLYDDNPAAVPAGCLPQNCRRLVAAGIIP